MNQSLILTNYKEELEKVAATAALKAIRALVNAGNIAKAESLAAKLLSRGALKTSKQGSQLRFLGSGSEGPAHMVIGAKDAPGRVLVRKMLDPGGAIFSKEQAATKFNTLRRLRAKPVEQGGHKFSKGSDSFAKLVSNKLHKTPSGGRYYHSEFVPGKDLYQTAVRGRGLPQATKDAIPELLRQSDRAGAPAIGSTPWQNVLRWLKKKVLPRRFSRRLWGDPRGARQGSTIKDAIRPGVGSANTGNVIGASNATNVMVTPSGKPKIIDFFVSPRNAPDGATYRKMEAGVNKMLSAGKRSPGLKELSGTKTVARGVKAKPPTEGRALRPSRQYSSERMEHFRGRRRAAHWRDIVPGAKTSVKDVPAAGGLRNADVVNTLRGLGPGSPRAGGAATRARWTGAQPKGAGSPRSESYERMMLNEAGARNQKLLEAIRKKEPFSVTNPPRLGTESRQLLFGPSRVARGEVATRAARPIRAGVDLPPVDPFGATVPKGLQFDPTRLAPRRSR